ncbi:MAG: hypothetical protein KJ926_00565, partial [Candidatus Omnitrophica bacterium]|nr:hypothetical protein [Candidatus Omnitrophota bacterium]
AEGKIIPKEQAMDGEFAFYSGDFAKASSLFAAFTKTKDKDFALWNNQLGSIYLAAGDYKQALNAFLDAYYLMNNVSAFSRLESRAVSLIGEEREKAYKGDPYEKVYNSLYVALLLEREHDYDNALAAVKTGILCDSDVEGGLYKSDVTLLYLLAARFEALRNNQPMSDEYFQKAQEAYLLSHPINRGVVSDEQSKLNLLSQKQKELDKLMHREIPSKEDKEDEDEEERSVTPKRPGTNFSAKTKADESKGVPKKSKKVLALEAEIKELETAIATLTGVRTDKGKEISREVLKQVVDKNNNVLFVIELGRGPVKYPIGQYGHISIFTSKPYKANSVILLVDKKDNFDGNKSLCNNDILYQASTRGGRLMDGILKGKAQFKETTAQISYQLSQMSQQMSNQANQLQMQASTSGTYSNAGAGASYAAAGLAVISLAFAIGSAMANPAADVRHWSLLPAEIRVIPMKLPVGLHHIQLQVSDANNSIITELCKEFDVNILEGDNIIIRRIIE